MGKKTTPQPHPAQKTQMAKEESRNGPRVCGFVSVEEDVATTLQVRAWCMCTHEMYIAIYALDEKNHLNAFGAYNVTFMVCFLM